MQLEKLALAEVQLEKLASVWENILGEQHLCSTSLKVKLGPVVD